jgi:hypothetical protein
MFSKMTKILDWLYLGNRIDAMDEKILKSVGITHILNSAHE